jgi:hypothetical protein
MDYVAPIKRSTACDIPSQLRKKVSTKVFNSKTKSFSNWQCKNYASDVLEFICKIIKGDFPQLSQEVHTTYALIFIAFSLLLCSQVEVVSKELCQKGQTKLAWDIIYAVLIDMFSLMKGTLTRLKILMQFSPIIIFSFYHFKELTPVVKIPEI